MVLLAFGHRHHRPSGEWGGVVVVTQEVLECPALCQMRGGDCLCGVMMRSACFDVNLLCQCTLQSSHGWACRHSDGEAQRDSGE